MKNNITKFYKKMLIKSLIEDNENWIEKRRYIEFGGGVVSYNYESPLYGNIQFVIEDGVAFVKIDGEIYLYFLVWVFSYSLRESVKQFIRRFNEQKLQKSLEEYLIN